ncbi:hypothetical protein COU74_02680 [Candidatus Peregrinibacteria bacterium CG10_big_fil_rev_8_21_14_0_10_36_19]|nr:MAG: hypothetical protein COU74_02680 [Candidatus Peregrinibacteria bacterium CG10_big_fil_rev_8_21_14_0_10_36_19]
MAMKKVIILGSTGSLGTQSIEVLKKYRKEFEIIGLSGNKNVDLLRKQAKELGVKNLATTPEEILSLASHPDADVVINVISGIAGFSPTQAALKSKKTLILGNKESIIIEGLPSPVIPLDSEHNAIFEILKCRPNKNPARLVIPASGGPLLNIPDLSKVTLEKALSHPKWSMGAKISIESATLINKGFEIVEAHYLFGVPLEKIEAKIHPECEIHGIVEFEDGETLAYFGKPDMKEHIENALLHVLGVPTKRDIREVDLKSLNLPSPPNHLPGIELVLKAHRQGKMREFLVKEEESLEKLFAEKINFPTFLEELF